MYISTYQPPNESEITKAKELLNQLQSQKLEFSSQELQKLYDVNRSDFDDSVLKYRKMIAVGGGYSSTSITPAMALTLAFYLPGKIADALRDLIIEQLLP